MFFSTIMNQAPAIAFTFWPLFFCGFSAIGIFYSLRLILRSHHSTEVILGIYLVLHSITLLEYTFYWTNAIFQATFLIEISLLFPLLYGPLLIVYFDHSFGITKSSKLYAAHFIPFLIFLALKTPFYLSSPAKKLYHVLDIPFASAFEYFDWIKIFHLSIYSGLIFWQIHNRTGVGSMRIWAKSVLGFFLIYVVLVVSYKLIITHELYTLQIDYGITLASCLSIIFIAWYGVGFPEIANGQSIKSSLLGRAKSYLNVNYDIVRAANYPTVAETCPSNEPFEKYKNSGLPESYAVEIATRLEQLMEKDKLYAENDLSLNKLADKLGTSKHFVSQVINQHFKMNFFDYVNLKRIEEAKRLLASHTKDELNIIEIAYLIGFNRKGTFNSVFKKFTGTTPSEFRAHPR